MATPPSNTKGETTPKQPTTTYGGASAVPTPANNAGGGSALGDSGFVKGGGQGENVAPEKEDDSSNPPSFAYHKPGCPEGATGKSGNVFHVLKGQ